METIKEEIQMECDFTYIYKDELAEDKTFLEVKEIAEKLLEHLNTEAIQSKINAIHKPYAQSSEIQDVFIDKAIELGFVSEREGLFNEYETSRLRPDYYKKLDSGGILMEVERGKTINNNMDLLDLWKCHICKEANYLFLIVPKRRQKLEGGRSITFDMVEKRLTPFFEKENYVNVQAVFLFGY